jgi:hypothetical protein
VTREIRATKEIKVKKETMVIKESVDKKAIQVFKA